MRPIATDLKAFFGNISAIVENQFVCLFVFVIFLSLSFSADVVHRHPLVYFVVVIVVVVAAAASTDL